MGHPELLALKSGMLRSSVRLQSDKRLVELLRGGIDSAFDAIVQRYRSPLLRYAGRMVGPDRAEDIVQETFMNAYKSLRQDDRPMQLKPWLYRVAHNVALDGLRQEKVTFEQLDENYDGVRQPPDHLEQKEQLFNLVARMRALPERQRIALVLRELEGRSSEEIARELDEGIPETRQLVHRAREKLRNGVGALIPLPLLFKLRTLGAGGRSAAAGSQQAGQALAGTGVKAGLAKLGATVAIAAGLGAVGGVAVGEIVTASRDRSASGKPTATVTLSREVPSAHARGARSRSGSARTERKRGTSSDSRSAVGGPSVERGRAEGGRPGGSSGDPGTAPERPSDRGSTGGGPDSPAPASAPVSQPSQPPSGGGGGGGGNGGGSPGGEPPSGSTCIGPIAELPPICLPDLGAGESGGGSGGGLPSLP